MRLRLLAPAPNLMMNIGGLLKMAQTVTVFSFRFTFITISIIEISEGKEGPTLRLIFVCFRKVVLPYSRVGA
jgi:hypothetical protein